jgi:hypothetical protein
MTSYRCTCGNSLLTAEEVGEILDTGNGPLTPASARKAMARGNVSEARGYPSDQVIAYARGRPGKGRWGHK